MADQEVKRMDETPLYLGHNAVAQLAGYCQERHFTRFLLVSDENTHAALGRHVEAALQKHGWDVRAAVLGGTEVLADERRIVEVLVHGAGDERIYLAVGSGTITDIARYASYSARNPFISLPTAPSVDAYTSGGAALVLGGFKITVPAQKPAAIFADLPTLCSAPRDMIAAGFGDVLGKYTSLADWELGALLLDEPYNPNIAGRARRALRATVARAAEIGRASEKGIAPLMEALLESGRCMADLGSSRPASGSEHVFSHFWEMRRLAQHRPPILHGIQVGIGTLLSAQRYAAIRDLDHDEVFARLSAASPPPLVAETARMRAAFGDAAGRVIDHQRPFLEMMLARFVELQQRIEERWPAIQEIAAGVPGPQRIAALLRQGGAPDRAEAAGLEGDEVEQALAYAHYLRSRFTVNTLGRILGLW
jgi:glycerol-1-phosphate dehydrogenase [NAD(P)+]